MPLRFSYKTINTMIEESECSTNRFIYEKWKKSGLLDGLDGSAARHHAAVDMAIKLENESRKYWDYAYIPLSNPCSEIELDECTGGPKHDPVLEEMCRQHDEYFWPHKNGCPICGHDAYVGLEIVECCVSSCQNFVNKEGM